MLAESDNYKLSPLGILSAPEPDLSSVVTPALLYDLPILLGSLKKLSGLDYGRCKLLYPLKTASFEVVIRALMPGLDGLSASSLFEARMARDLLGMAGTVHLTTPGVRSDEIKEIAELCTAISFNSLRQFDRYSADCAGKCSAGIRINPGISFIPDPKYDPCGPYSRLGVPLHELRELLRTRQELIASIEGLHFHSNCESRSFSELLHTVNQIRAELPELIERISWLNLGGGYLPAEAQDPENFSKVVDVLMDLDCAIFFEPGAGIVNSAGFIVTAVLDTFRINDKQIVILDTTVNHVPEVIEYNVRVGVLQAVSDAPYSCILSGCTCLPGDSFGEYQFPKPLQPGDRITFTNVGAYTLAKANTFNGINLPAVYINDGTGVYLARKYDYFDFVSRWKDGTQGPR